MEYKPDRLHLYGDHLSWISDTVRTVDIEDELPDANILSITVVPTWDTYISEILSTQILPNHLDANKQRKIEVNSRHYAIIAKWLYRCGIDRLL